MPDTGATVYTVFTMDDLSLVTDYLINALGTNLVAPGTPGAPFFIDLDTAVRTETINPGEEGHLLMPTAIEEVAQVAFISG